MFLHSALHYITKTKNREPKGFRVAQFFSVRAAFKRMHCRLFVKFCLVLFEYSLIKIP